MPDKLQSLSTEQKQKFNTLTTAEEVLDFEVSPLSRHKSKKHSVNHSFITTSPTSRCRGKRGDFPAVRTPENTTRP